MKTNSDVLVNTNNRMKTNFNSLIISLVAFSYWMAQYIYVPILPLLVQSRTDHLEMVGLALSIYGLGHILIRIPAGLAVGRLGKNKPLIVIGLLTVAAGVLVMGFSKNIFGLIMGRGITGIAAGTWVPLVLLFNKSLFLKSPVEATTMITFVSASARLLASSLSTVFFRNTGLQIPFLMAAGIALLAIFLLVPVREEKLRPEKISLKNFSTVIRKKEVVFPSVLSMLAQHVNWAVTFGFLPILAQSFGASDRVAELLVSVFLLFFLFSNLLAAANVLSLSLKKLVLAGFLLLILGLVVASFGKSIPLLFLAQALIGFSIGICEPLLMGMSIQTLSGSEQSSALGFHQTVYAVGMFSGPFVSGWLSDMFGIQHMFLVTAFLIGFIFLFCYRKI